MSVNIVLFFVSALVVVITSILIYRQRLGDAGDRRMTGFYPLCIVTIVWTMLEAVKLLSAPDYYSYIFVPKVFVASIVPYIAFWLILNFTESKYAKSKLIKILLITIPALNGLMLFTNPLHKLYFANFNAPLTGTIPPAGPAFWVNIAFITIGFFLSYGILMRYTFNNLRRYPFLIITGIGILVPFLLYIAFAANLFGLVYDLSPVGLFCTIVLFTYFSYAPRMRKYRQDLFSSTLAGITKSPMLSSGNVQDAADMIAQEGCKAIGAKYVGIWNVDGEILKNVTLYDLKKGICRLQKEVDISKCPGYTEMLLNERRVVINDVRAPNVMSPIMTDYDPDICALLITPVRVNGQLSGVVCVEQYRCEAFPEKREWTAEEQNFASSLADLMTIAFESAERYNLLRRNETMMNNLPGMVYQGIYSPKGLMFIFVSEGVRELLGYAPSELINTSMPEFARKIFKPRDMIEFEKREAKMLEDGSPIEFTFLGTTKDGSDKWIWIRGYLIKKNYDGSQQMAEGFLADVTERRKLEAADLASQAKDRFLAHMSHEMRTPMNAILGIAEIQLQNESLSEDMTEVFGQISESGDMLLSIVNDILDLSKIESGKLEIVPIKYDFPDMIKDTVKLNCMRYESKPIEFTLQVDENIPHNLYGDELRIKQVLNNILSNAFKYTDKGRIEFSVCAGENSGENTTIIFSVSDTGQGMSKNQVAVLFDEYTRFNIETNRETTGTGLGMSITKHLVDLMSGTISVQSEPDKGTVFTVSLPQKRVDNSVCGRELAEKLRSFRFQSMAVAKKTQFIREYMPYGSVLAVDDVVSNIYVAKGMLSPYGLKIETASSGLEAIEKIKNGQIYDIVFMDHMMPKMDGVEAVKIIRGMGYNHTIIALTANALIGQEKMFLNNCFDGFISKPIDSREMNRILNEYIKNKKPAEVVEAAQREIIRRKNNPAAEEKTNAVNKELSAAAAHDIENALEVLDELLPELNAIPHSREGAENSGAALALFTTTIHGMKSALANIRETQLSEFALRLEQAAQQAAVTNGKTAGLMSDTNDFIISLRSLLEKIKPQQTSDDPELFYDDIVFLQNKLNEIKTASQELIPKDAKTALIELKQKIWPQKINDIINDMSIYLIRGEYSKIVSAVDNFLE